MNKANNNWIWWTLGGVATISIGLGAFLFFKQRKKEKEEGKKNNGSSEVKTEEKPVVQTQVQNQTTTTAPPPLAEADTNFNTKEQGNAFRRWVRAKDPNFAQEIDLSASGDYNNSNIKKAYAKYGNEFQQKNMSLLSNGLKWIGSDWKVVDDNLGILERYYESGDANNGARISFDRNGRVYIQGRKNGGLGSKWKAGGWYIDGGIVLTAPIKILINGKEYASSSLLSDMKNDKVWAIWNDGNLWNGSAFTPFVDFVNSADYEKRIDGAVANDYQDEML
jgi:hypothetical protein